MTNDDYKKYTKQAKAGIKGEAFFESLISDYSIPHHVVGPKDLGVDYFCEWVFGDKPTGILYAVQIKTLAADNVKPKFIRRDEKYNKLEIYEISNSVLKVDNRIKNYWRGLGIPIFLFVVIYSERESQGGRLDCYYKRFTSLLTTENDQEDKYFYKVNDGDTFLAFADPKAKKYGFVRDLFIDLMRCSYSRGSISYISPRTLGLEQFPEEEAVFFDLFNEYRENVIKTYDKMGKYLEGIIMSDLAVPTEAPPELPDE